MQRHTIAVLMVACAAPAMLRAAPQKDASAAAQLQAAINKETVEADLDAAIKQFQAIVAKYAKTDRAVAATALLHIAECHRKKGDAESRRIFDQVIREYGDQTEAAARARASLASVGGADAMTFVSVWKEAPERGIGSIASDQPLIGYRNNQTGDLMLRNLATGETRNLTNIGPAEQGRLAGDVLVSADGKMVAYVWSTLISVDGKWVAPDTALDDRKEIRTIAADGTGMRIHLSGKSSAVPDPVALSPDNQRLLVESWAGVSGAVPAHPVLQSLSLADNTVKPFAGGFWGDTASFSPDGKLVALEGSMRPLDEGLFVANADGTNVRPLLAEPVDTPRWTPDGKWIVFLSGRTGQKAVWAIPSAGGEPRLLKQEPGISMLYGFPRDGALFCTTGRSLTDIQIVKLNPTTFAPLGEPNRFINTSLGRNELLSFSPDGKWIAWRSHRPREGDVLVARPATGGEEKVLHRFQTGGFFSWFPDSSALVIRRLAGRPSVLDRVDVTDGRIAELDWGVFPPGLPVVAEEGRMLFWFQCDANTAPGCALVRIDPRTKKESREPMNEMSSRGPSALSPDGKWLAVIGRAPSANVSSLFVRPAAPGGRLVERARGVVAIAAAFTFTFTPDSKNLVYAAAFPPSQLNEFRIVPVEGGPAKPLPFKGQFPSFHPDGRLAFTQNSGSAEIWMLRNLPLK